MILLWFTISVIVCLCMYVLVKVLFWIAVWHFFGKETVLSVFCLMCVYCGADALSASFFAISVLEKRIGQLYRFLIIAFLSICNRWKILFLKFARYKKQQMWFLSFITVDLQCDWSDHTVRLLSSSFSSGFRRKYSLFCIKQPSVISYLLSVHVNIYIFIAGYLVN